MARVACTVMLKDEVTLTEPFLHYHSALFGAENIYVWDNGSTEPKVLEVLSAFEREGGHVDRSRTTPADFRDKGEIIGDFVKHLDAEADYELYILLDCDEFVAVRSEDGFTCEPGAIHACLNAMRDADHIWHVRTNLANLPGRPGLFRVADYSKTIFPRGVMGSTDHGYHGGWTRDGRPDLVPCDIVYVHFHYRPYEEVHRFARQKLAAEMSAEELDDPERLRQFRGRGWHLVGYVLGGPESYYREIRNIHAPYAFPEILERFAAIGSEAPFSGFVLPPEPDASPRDGMADQTVRKPCFAVLDEVSVLRVRGWAVDPAACDAPVRARFLVNGLSVWEGTCDGDRPDVRQSGQASAHVGFAFEVPPAGSPMERRTLTAEGPDGTPLLLLMDGQAHDSIQLCQAEASCDPPIVVIDEANASRIRGWSIDPGCSGEPVLLRFLIGGRIAWEGACDVLRPDLIQGGHPTGRAGFDFLPLPLGSVTAGGLLTVEDASGKRLQMSVAGHSGMELLLAPAPAALEGGVIHSRIDSFRNGRVSGWILRSVATPEGPRLLGRCTVAIVHEERVVTRLAANILRPDVGVAFDGESACGFDIEIPRPLLAPGRSAVFRLFVMPEGQELTGSPCVLARSFEGA